MYHSIEKKELGKYVISPGTFENDVKYIKEQGYNTVNMDDLIKYVYEGVALPEKPIMITFDDGCYNNLEYAVPILKKYDCKGVISVVGKYTDDASDPKKESSKPVYLRWKDIEEIIEDGTLEVQNHSYDMHKTSGRNGAKKRFGESYDNYKQVLSKDLLKLEDKLEENFNYKTTTFTYPLGAVSKESTDILKELGFKASLRL
jgi:peptidoglycan/xylan/chitin deacetylase (PgdA/CDA1 family)